MPGLDAAARRDRLARARLYLCTGLRPDLADFADAALAGGVDVLQLREKGIEARDELAALEVLAEACARHGALLAVNDRADVALAAAADVLHLGQDDLPVDWARRVVGDDVIVGRSSHSASETAAAADEPGVDYFCVGPCWPTRRSPAARRPASTSSAPSPSGHPPGRGSPSAASTMPASMTCWPRVRSASSSCGRSPRPPIPGRPPPVCGPASPSRAAPDANQRTTGKCVSSAD
jgi:thiamine-phosphate pyrophosphorylase